MVTRVDRLIINELDITVPKIRTFAMRTLCVFIRFRQHIYCFVVYRVNLRIIAFVVTLLFKFLKRFLRRVHYISRHLILSVKFDWPGASYVALCFT